MRINAEQIRSRAISRIASWLEYNHHPRFDMFLIVSGTGAAAFLFSFLLFSAGLVEMWARYPLAIGLAYLVFLGLLRLWLSYQGTGGLPKIGEVVLDNPDSCADTAVDVAGLLSKDIRLSDGEDEETLCGLDLDELSFVVIAIAALGAGFAVCLYVVWTAPVLLAEVLVDGLVMSRIYRKLKITDQSDWLVGAVKRTRLSALLVALFFSLAGLTMVKIVPGAQSIWPVIDYLMNPS